jgi:hypothetical protein
MQRVGAGGFDRQDFIGNIRKVRRQNRRQDLDA